MDMMPTGIEVADLADDHWKTEPRDRRGQWTTAGGNIRNPGEYAGLTDEQYDKYVAPSLKQPEMFWRTHQRGEPFSRDNAWSADLQGGEEQKGYSAFRSPEELHRYITQSGTGVFGEWDVGSRDVIRFWGHEIDTGADGEPLVEPVDDDPVERMSWDKFARRISRTRRQMGTSNTGLLSTDLAAWEHEPRNPHTGEWVGLNAKDYEGTVGRKDHITRTESGQIPLAAIAGLRGAEGEMPGEHRNMQGARWETFKADIAARGIHNPVFVTVDHGQEPKISEGSHRRDAAVELGLQHVPVEIRYYGHAEQQGTVLDRRQAELSNICPDCGCPADGLSVQLAGDAWKTELRDARGRWTLNSLNPTGSLFAEYAPESRARAPSGPTSRHWPRHRECTLTPR